MSRNIRPLFNFDPPANGGFGNPSKASEQAFNREVEAMRARGRAQRRYGRVSA
jgi:hypothetical protein